MTTVLQLSKKIPKKKKKAKEYRSKKQPKKKTRRRRRKILNLRSKTYETPGGGK